MIKALIRWLMLFVLFSMGIIALMLTPIGLKTGLLIVSEFIPGKIQYHSSSGLISGPIEILDLHYQYRNNEIYIQRLYWQWHLEDVLFKKFHILSLKADNVHIRLAGETKSFSLNTGSSFLELINDPKKTQQRINTSINRFITDVKKFHLPMNFQIDFAEIHNLTIQKQNNTPLKIQTLTVKGSVNKNNIGLFLTSQITAPHPLKIKATVSGTSANYQFLFSILGDKFQWNFHGEGDENHLLANTNDSELMGGSIQGALFLRWAPDWYWNLNLRAQHFHLNQIQSQLPKEIDLDLQSHGAMKNEQWDTALQTTFSSQKNKINLQANYFNGWQIQWDIAATALQQLIPSVNGSLVSHGSWSGVFPQTITKGNLQLNSFSINQYKAENFNANWSIDWIKQNMGNLKVEANNLSEGNVLIHHLQLAADGNLQHHTVRGEINTSYATLQWNLLGQWLNAAWKGNLVHLAISSNKFQTLHMEHSAPFNISASSWNIPNLCLYSTANDRVCISSSKDFQKPWAITINSPQLHLTQLTDFLTPNLKLNGVLNFNLNATGKGLNIDTAGWRFNFLSGTVIYQVNENILKSSYENSFLQGYFNASGFHNFFQFNLPQGDFLTLKTELPLFQEKNIVALKEPISSTLTANIHNIKILSALIPNTIIPNGILVANLKMVGTLENPILQGSVTLKNGEIKIPSLNIVLDHISVALSASANTVNYTATAYSEDRPITIKGTTQLAPYFPTQASITGDNVLVMNTKEYVFYSSPQLHVELHGHQVNLTGTLIIPKGDIKPYDFRPTVNLPEEDVIFIGKPNSEKKNIWAFSSNVNVILGDDVDVDTMGVVGKLYGNLTIMAQPQQPTLATGRIGIHNGTYSIFGRTLIMDPGSNIQYTRSPLNNPILNLRGTRVVKSFTSLASQLAPMTYVVGIQFQGTFKSPKSNLFSIPASLTQSDILSYMLFDTIPNASTAGNYSLLAQALDILKPGNGGLLQSAGLIDQIRHGLGFSELGIESETTLNPLGDVIDKRTDFVVGRHLTDKIYIRYTRDVNTPTPGVPNINEITLSYFLTHHWSIQTYNNTIGTGGDILYTIEKN